ncbi:laccase domain protein [Marinicella pacifica]|uniref:Purine nucleoside phosphorylase n=1 Tax=Marinicella pacifica TaxID=1171543 RepID=A0A917FM00_9GAMM|nr:peptidoglycan editing factor PgeF [Marinicella pacifica]GGF91866.1 laccase domain protein [Marinicella pacifica]
MYNPYTVHQTKSKIVKILQTHRDLLITSHPRLNIHPTGGGTHVLQEITHIFNLPHRPVFMQQVHGNTCLELNSVPSQHFWQSADACYTRQTGILCVIMTADCLPVLITDEAVSFVAAVHCGWRSLYQGILTKLLQKIQSPHPLIVWFGPSICPHHYQVDNTFKNHYLKTHPDADRAFTEVIDNHCYADLKKLASVQLTDYKICRIEDAAICTYEDNSYDSWRLNKSPGRQASMIWISPKEPLS